MRFPQSNWTELAGWRYVRRENIVLPSLCLPADRRVVERDGVLLPVEDDRFPLRPGERVETRRVRFRTLGCWPLTAAVESDAAILDEVIAEVTGTRLSERHARIIDHDSAASMERKKHEGYF